MEGFLNRWCVKKGFFAALAVSALLLIPISAYSADSTDLGVQEIKVDASSAFDENELEFLDGILNDLLGEFDNGDKLSDKEKKRRLEERFKSCMELRKKICEFYCRYLQTEHSYDDCYDGWFVWDGCIQELEARCRANLRR